MTTLPQTSSMRMVRQPQGGASPVVPVGGPAGTPAVSSAALTGGKQMTGGDVWRVIRANLWLIIISLIVSAIVGFAVNWLLLRYYPRYTAYGFIKIEQAMNIMDPDRDRIYENPQNLSVDQRTHAQLLRTPSLFSRVLQNSSEIRATTWFKQFKGDSQIADAKEDLIDNFGVSPIVESKLIQVSMTYTDPKACRIIVEEVVNQHLKEQQEFTRAKTSNRSILLNNLKRQYDFQLREIRRELSEKSARLSIDGLGVPGRVGGTETELTEFIKTQLTLQLRYNQAQNLYDQVIAQLREGIDPPQVEQIIDQDLNIKSLRQQRDAQRVEYQVVEQQLGRDHPRVKAARWSVEALDKQLEDLTDEKKATARTQLVSELRSQVTATQQDLDAVNKRIGELKNVLGELSNTMAVYLTLKDEEEAMTELQDDVDAELSKISQIESQQDRSGVAWGNKPETPDIPSFPELKITLPVAIMLGLGLSLGIAFLRELLDTSVRSPRDVARVGQMNMLGIVNDEQDDPQSQGARLPLVIFETPHSMLAEQLRQVRTRLQHAASLDTTRSILVTSPSPSDGKTTICVNLAAGLALNGRRILLVDANFRRPEIHKIFGLTNDLGFGDVLSSIDQFEQAVRPTQVPNLDVLVSGPKPANASELMESQLLIDFIERALEEYDHVIFDSGPLLLVSETVALAPRVDGVITIVRAKINSRGLLQRMRDALRQVRAEHLGVVLNAVKAQGGGYYGRSIKTYYEYQNGHNGNS